MILGTEPAAGVRRTIPRAVLAASGRAALRFAPCASRLYDVSLLRSHRLAPPRNDRRPERHRPLGRGRRAGRDDRGACPAQSAASRGRAADRPAIQRAGPFRRRQLRRLYGRPVEWLDHDGPAAAVRHCQRRQHRFAGGNVRVPWARAYDPQLRQFYTCTTTDDVYKSARPWRSSARTRSCPRSHWRA